MSGPAAMLELHDIHVKINIVTFQSLAALYFNIAFEGEPFLRCEGIRGGHRAIFQIFP